MSDQTPNPFQSPDSAGAEKIDDGDASQFWTAQKVHLAGTIGLFISGGLMGTVAWISVFIPPSQFHFLEYTCSAVALLIMISSAICMVSSHWFPNPKRKYPWRKK
ncbi:MAG: hypothetical protein AAF623_06340 [Planctomycetota bacterium]